MTTTEPQTTLEPADWSGSAGERWAEHIDHYEPMLAAIGTALIAHAGFAPGERVVEIGCGGGALTRQIAGAVAPGGSVLGLDISPALVALAEARAKAAGVANVAFQAGDAQTNMPEAAPFDRLVSRFGVMFFADPAAAMRNLHAMLVPGGTLTFAVWGPPADNPAISTIVGIARPLLNLAPPDPLGPSPFAFADPDYLRGLLEPAGFSDLDFTLWRGDTLTGRPGDSAETVAGLMMSTGSLADPIRDAGEDVRNAIHTQLAAAIADRITPGGAVFPAAVHFVTATA